MPWVAPCAVAVTIEQFRACAGCGARLRAAIALTATAAISNLLMALSSLRNAGDLLPPCHFTGLLPSRRRPTLLRFPSVDDARPKSTGGAYQFNKHKPKLLLGDVLYCGAGFALVHFAFVTFVQSAKRLRLLSITPIVVQPSPLGLGCKGLEVAQWV
jgi:hypothetical protein